MTDRKRLTAIIEVLTRRIGEIEARVLSGGAFAQLSMRQLQYVDVIARLGHPTLSELARELAVSRPSVTAAVARLETSGLVARVPSDEDRRVAHVHLTRKGRRVNRLHDDTHRALAGLFCDALDRTELHTLVLLLDKVVDSEWNSSLK
jgi:DNA-binding MarR family transcriptional regulator